MANSTKDASQRSSAAQIVENMLEEIVALANTDVSGRYIFAGTKTDTAPFDQTGTYSGNNDLFSIKISKDSSLAVGNDGQDVFSTLFTNLSAFKTALENDDVDGIKTAITDLDTDFDTITSKVSDIGSKMLRMEVKENLLQNLDISNTERLSTIEDADVAQAIMDLSTIEFTYQAALSSSAKVLTLSLVDYLK
jgi:flagellar hook-associated protein 3 FlgL